MRRIINIYFIGRVRKEGEELLPSLTTCPEDFVLGRQRKLPCSELYTS